MCPECRELRLALGDARVQIDSLRADNALFSGEIVKLHRQMAQLIMRINRADRVSVTREICKRP